MKMTVNFEIITCYKCNMQFAVPEAVRKRWLDSGDSFYCPAGHEQAYGESTVKRLERKIAEQTRYKEWANDRANRAENRAATAERRRIAQKAANTRLRNKMNKGE